MAEKDEKGDLQNLPACVAEFIKQLIRKMRYRRKVRQDVQAEIAAHFEDELRDCTTDAQREQKARQLIAGFGDMKLLAVLLRRAKKRCRPLWRTVVARAFQAIGILILCFIVYVLWFISGRPVITTNYVAQLNRLVRPAADESMNAAPLYGTAVELYKELSDDFLVFFAENHQAIINTKKLFQAADIAKDIDELLANKGSPDFAEKRENIQGQVSKVLADFLREDYDKLTAEQRSVAERWLNEHSDALELIIEGSRKPYYWRTYESGAQATDEMINVLLPDLSDLRNIARCMRYRALSRAEQGRYEDAFSDIQACYRLGQHMRGDRTLIEQLVGIAIEAFSLRPARYIASHHRIDSAVLAGLQHNLEQLVAGENFRVSFEVEKLCIYDEIQRSFTVDRFGKGHLYLPRLRQVQQLSSDYQVSEGFEQFVINMGMLVVYAPRLLGHPNKEETLAATNELYGYYEQLSRKSAVQMHAEQGDTEEKFEQLIEGNIFLSLLAPAVWRVIEISHRLPTDVGATVTMIALARYKQDKGRYPQDLNQLLAEGYLRQLPIDSFSDKPLVYRKIDDDFILYSFGPNCVDDGGKQSTDKNGRISQWGDNGDRVYWPPPEPQASKQQ